MYVYIAGPYTKPNPNENVYNAIQMANRLAEKGYTPFIPHLYHLWDTVSPKSYDFWMQLDFNWILKCDALLRLPGESSGADLEIVHATKNGIPVFYSLESLLLDNRTNEVQKD